MKLDTTGFKDGKENTQFECGMYRRPYTGLSRCKNLAVQLVTEESFVAYRNYWHIWNRFHIKDEMLPMMHLKLICQEHIDILRNLPDNPRTRHPDLVPYDAYRDSEAGDILAAQWEGE